MTQEEMRKQFYQLYQLMASSQNVAYMRAFGTAHKEMMEWMIANKPELAQEWIEKLGSIEWKNYLTTREAERIVSDMLPKAPWARDAWKNVMESLGLAREEKPYYNSCALWVTMNMIYSDSAQTIAKIIGKPLQDIPAEQMVRAVHALAIDKLKDADEVFNIRAYFGL